MRTVDAIKVHLYVTYGYIDMCEQRAMAGLMFNDNDRARVQVKSRR